VSLLVALADAVRDGARTGDTQLARVANEAIGKLLGVERAEVAEVVDLNAERGRRGGGEREG
jgi:hypothetical protein